MDWRDMVVKSRNEYNHMWKMLASCKNKRRKTMGALSAAMIDKLLEESEKIGGTD